MVVGRKKESMKTESLVLAGKEKQHVMKRKRVETDLEFRFRFSVVVLTYLFAGFIFTRSRQV